ncbi:hypothetical protein [Bradyrhizobium sp. 186]|uniref:hypothetical protein n=1 Tax=Bradyrhizobium sp. 186 TaxID=2782654 RepID=UPI003211B5C0
MLQTNAVRAFSAMFLAEPHSTVRRYKSLSDRVGKDIFIHEHKLYPYYTSAYALYLLEFLFRNQKVDSKYKVARFQILLAVRLLGNDSPIPKWNANAMDKYCEAICESLWDSSKADALFDKALKAIDAVAGAGLDRDKLHEAKFTEELMLYCAIM